MLVVAGKLMQSQMQNGHALLLVERQAQPHIADIVASLELVQVVRCQKMVPVDVAAVMCVLVPGAAVDPLGAEVLGQIDVDLRRVGVGRLQFCR